MEAGGGGGVGGGGQRLVSSSGELTAYCEQTQTFIIHSASQLISVITDISAVSGLSSTRKFNQTLFVLVLLFRI